VENSSSEKFRGLNLDDSLSLKEDRRAECAEYLKVFPNDLPTEAVATSKAWRNTWLEKAYQGVEDDEGAARAASSVSREWAIRFLVGQCLYPYASAINFHLGSFQTTGENWRFLDYGCGAGDIALYVAREGHPVVICDLSPGNLDLAAWRFNRRDMCYTAIPTTAEEPYPVLPKVEYALSSAVLEHLARPDEAIRRIADAVIPGGYFVESQFLERPANVGGDHLQSAADRRELTLTVVNEYFYGVGQQKMAGVPVTIWRRK